MSTDQQRRENAPSELRIWSLAVLGAVTGIVIPAKGSHEPGSYPSLGDQLDWFGDAVGSGVRWCEGKLGLQPKEWPQDRN